MIKLQISMPGFFERSFWGNSVLQYLIVLAACLAASFFIRIIKRIVFKRLESFTEHTENTIDDSILEVSRGYVVPFLYIWVNYVIIKQLNLSPKLDGILKVGMSVVAAFYIISLINKVIQL